MFSQRQNLAILLTIILVVQSPLSFAFSCAQSSRDNFTERSMAMMMTMLMETQIEMNVSRRECHDEMSNPGTDATKDQTSCQSGCCLALSAPALLNAGTLRSMVPRETAEYALTDQLVTTYLKSDIRPPIS